MNPSFELCTIRGSGEPGASKSSFKVEMKHTKEIGSFIKKVESAQRAAANSKLVFK